MSSDDRTVIRVLDLGKRYAIYNRPQDRLKQAFVRDRKQYFKPFWALRNVSLEVKRGESVGIIGRNGSGKSTLLQIIAGTLMPTEGEVHVEGRLAALLELGSGFNPQFTGRDNVFLTASILRIPPHEIEARFDEIAAFADIGDYIDQPVKTYSSGMFARLAFAVAVSVAPDILIVDEILAVGDIGFQQKCVARMREMRERGLSLLFVSHSPDAVRSICQRALFLSEGQPVYFGPAEQAMDRYLNHIRDQTNLEALKTQTDLGEKISTRSRVSGAMRYGTGHVQIESVELLDAAGQPCRAFRFGEEMTLETRIRSFIATEHLSLSFLVRDMTGIDLTGTTTFDEHVPLPTFLPGQSAKICFRFTNCFRQGHFGVSLAVTRVTHRDGSDNVLFDQIDGCIAFSVIPDPDRPVHYKFHNPVQISVEATDGLHTRPLTGVGSGT